MADYATLLRDHTTLTCRAVDRVFLQVVPYLIWNLREEAER